MESPPDLRVAGPQPKVRLAGTPRRSCATRSIAATTPCTAVRFPGWMSRCSAGRWWCPLRRVRGRSPRARPVRKPRTRSLQRSVSPRKPRPRRSRHRASPRKPCPLPVPNSSTAPATGSSRLRSTTARPSMWALPSAARRSSPSPRPPPWSRTDGRHGCCQVATSWLSGGRAKPPPRGFPRFRTRSCGVACSRWSRSRPAPWCAPRFRPRCARRATFPQACSISRAACWPRP